jgi:Zn-dependent membrane protease YugP
MSWGRFLVVLALSAIVLVPAMILTDGFVLELEEPLRTGVIIIGAALVFTAIDVGVGWMLARRGQAETLD